MIRFINNIKTAPKNKTTPIGFNAVPPRAYIIKPANAIIIEASKVRRFDFLLASEFAFLNERPL